jgi:hypothetical protein
MVQAPEVASRIAVSHFRRAVSKSEVINDLLTRYHMALMCPPNRPLKSHGANLYARFLT